MPTFLNTDVIFHAPIVEHWVGRRNAHEEATRTISTRFERIQKSVENVSDDSDVGDQILAQIRDTFKNGLGIIFMARRGNQTRHVC
jgi:hypothetical protein